MCTSALYSNSVGVIRHHDSDQCLGATSNSNDDAQGNERPTMTWPERKNRIVNVVMFSLTGLCAVFIIAVMVIILGYLLINGGRYLSFDFFTKLPTPVGETGGGMANAIVGTGKLLLLASAIGLPIGFLAGVYLAEFGGKTFPFIVRYTTDLLNGVPSIVIAIFAYALIVLPMKHFSTFAGGVALGIMMIPIALRTTDDFLRSVPMSLREGALALGASKAKPLLPS